MMSPEIIARLDKVRKLMDSPNPGEAAAAAARYYEMLGKYLPDLAKERIDQAVDEIERKGYAVWEIDGGWYVTPADDLAKVIAHGDVSAALIGCASQLPDLSGEVAA